MNDDDLIYHFSDAELKELARFFRNSSTDVPNVLESIRKFADNYVCNSMTIDEAEKFFKE